MQCGHPLDRVHGILGIVQDISRLSPRDLLESTVHPLPIPIDYNKDPTELFIEMGNFIIQRYENLDMFSFVSHEILPSSFPKFRPDDDIYPQFGPDYGNYSQFRPGDDSFPQFGPDDGTCPQYRPVYGSSRKFQLGLDKRALPSWVSIFTFNKTREMCPLVTSSITYPVIPDVFSACGDQYQDKRVQRTLPGALGQPQAIQCRQLVLTGYILDRVLRVYPVVDEAIFTAAVSQRQIFFDDDDVVALCRESLRPDESLFSVYWRTCCANQVQVRKLIPSDAESKDQGIFPENELQESARKLEEIPTMAL